MLSVLISAKNLILDILFPPICLNCRKHLETRTTQLCENCHSSIKLNSAFFCPICRARLAENKKICHFDSQYLLAAAGNYDDPILQNLIHCFKYRKMDFLAPILGELLIKYLNSLNPKFRILNSCLPTGMAKFLIAVPVPLYFFREKSRGFNQAELLAKVVARHFNLPLIDALKKTKNNEPQAKCKDAEKRAANVADCFKIKNPENIKGKNIILIDDVFTSGATMTEAVKILKQNGAKKIIALVLAKA